MGMYTGLRVTAKIKPEFSDLIRHLHEIDPFVWSNRWERAMDVSGVRFDEWLAFDRCNQIPFGMLCYMPDDFGRTDEGDHEYDPDIRIWEFACSLKNYEGEIKFFVEKVLKVISEEIYRCESLYEEFPYPNDPHPFDDVSTRYQSRDDYSYWKQFAIDWTK